MLYLLSHVDNEIEMVENVLLDDTWGAVQQYMKGNVLALKRGIDSLSSELILRRFDDGVYRTMKRIFPYEIEAEDVSTQIVHKLVRRGMKIISYMRK